jgi:hypothetical protein
MYFAFCIYREARQSQPVRALQITVLYNDQFKLIIPTRSTIARGICCSVAKGRLLADKISSGMRECREYGSLDRTITNAGELEAVLVLR